MPFLRSFREVHPSLPLYQRLPNVIKAKLSLIEDMHDQAWKYYLAKREKHPDPDFDTCLENIRLFWEEESRKIASKEEQEPCPGLADKLLNDLKEYIRLMKNPAFEPPPILSHLFGLLTGLWFFWVYWPFSYKWAGIDRVTKSLQEALGLTPALFGEIEAIFDLSLTKIALQVGMETANIHHWGKRERTRTLKSTQRRREKAEPWKQFVLAIYEFGEPIAPGTSRGQAIRMIRRQFEESKGKNAKWGVIPNDIKIPHRDSIIALLIEKGVHEKDFEQKGRLWFKKM